jgi:hypothetical protein
MPRYRKKPVIISAEQYLANKTPVPSGVTDLPEHVRVRMEGAELLHPGLKWIETLEGGHVVSPGDYIITGIKGEKYPCKAEIFLLTYEEVPDEELP